MFIYENYAFIFYVNPVESHCHVFNISVQAKILDKFGVNRLSTISK